MKRSFKLHRRMTFREEIVKQKPSWLLPGKREKNGYNDRLVKVSETESLILRKIYWYHTHHFCKKYRHQRKEKRRERKIESTFCCWISLEQQLRSLVLSIILFYSILFVTDIDREGERQSQDSIIVTIFPVKSQEGFAQRTWSLKGLVIFVRGNEEENKREDYVLIL